MPGPSGQAQGCPGMTVGDEIELILEAGFPRRHCRAFMSFTPEAGNPWFGGETVDRWVPDSLPRIPKIKLIFGLARLPG